MTYAITGPLARASGINYDVRKAFPYFAYDRIDFEVPLGERGDNYDRYLVRMEEMRQSIRIIRQALRDMPGGPLHVDAEGKVMESFDLVDEAKLGQTAGLVDVDSTVEPTLEGTEKRYQDRVMPARQRVVLPSKEDTYGNIEGLDEPFQADHGLSRNPTRRQAIPTFPSKAPTGNWASMWSVTARTDPTAFVCGPPAFSTWPDFTPCSKAIWWRISWRPSAPST